MKQTFPGWSLLMAAAVVAWLVAAPSPVAAQHAGHSGGGSGASGGGHSAGGGHSSGGGQSGSSAPSGGSGQSAPSGNGGTGTGGGSATARGSSGDGNGGGATTSTGGGDPVSASSRPHGGRPQTGEAVPRTSRPPAGGGTTLIVPGGYYGGYFPWGYEGLGIGDYYGGYYDPGYGGSYQGYSSGGAYEGRLRLKVKPKEAEVFVDGYFAGIVDDFDGVFQRLHIETGPHRIELRADGYEPLSFEVNIQPGRTLTYTGELKKLP